MAEKFDDKHSWIKSLKSIVSDYNNRPAKNTTFLRKDINDSNYISYLRERFATKDPEILLHSGVVSSFTPEMSRKIFKYAPGDKVIVAVEAMEKGSGSAFPKKSVSGAYKPQIHTVKSQHLRSSNDFYLTIAYTLNEPASSTMRYQSELRPALFAEKEAASTTSQKKKKEEEKKRKIPAAPEEERKSKRKRVAKKRYEFDL